MRMKMGPFPCTNCGRILLIDRIKTIEEEPDVHDVKHFSVVAVIDHASYESEAGNEFMKPEWQGMGRKELVKMIYAQRNEIKKLKFEALPFWQKPFRNRRFMDPGPVGP